MRYKILPGPHSVRTDRVADALDAVEHLDPDAQAELVAVIGRRLAERGRERIAATVAQARRELANGQSKPMTAAEIVREALS